MMVRKMLLCCGKAVSYAFALASSRISSPSHLGIIEMCSILAFVWND